VLGKLARQHDPHVLVGFDHADDAGVYQIAPDQALVQTVDFFTPIVDDPYIFGQIAATNSLSDIYAMGGKPMTALALVCFPEKGDLEVLEQILAGGLSKMMEAGCTIIGGHSIRDDETKFGYSVTGTVNPQRVLKNGGAQPGDHLLLTKALGTGVISTAIKKGVAKQSWIDAATASMTTLNKIASEVVVKFCWDHGVADNAPSTSKDEGAPPVHALTDITGFGLVGHLREMLLASDNVSAEISVRNLPLLDGALDCVRADLIPGGLKANREFAECVVDYSGDIPEEIRTILFDPQTAGGLLISAADNKAGALASALSSAGVAVQEVGRIARKSTKAAILVSP
jgi:selenide, water dikinase